MSADDTTWIAEASNRALEFLAVLAANDSAAVADRGRVFDALMDELDDPAKFATMMYSLVFIANAMRTSAAGDKEPGTWTFEIHTPFGRVPVDNAPPAQRWVARWLIACMNGDSTAAFDLWFASAQTENQARESVALLGGVLIGFLTHSVRTFLDAGRPFVMPEDVR